MILIGTSGFQYPEWKGTFYPEKLATAKMLGYYSERFATTEVNYTFRHLPSVKTLDRWSSETPDTFQFSLKAPQRITHFAKLRDCEQITYHFATTVLGLGAKLGAVLFQLPPQFRKDIGVLESFVRCMPAGIRPAFEFRHDSWFDDETYAMLRSADAALCIADTAEFKTPIVQTARFGYLRLRNETYTEGDIERWTDTVRELSKTWQDTFIYFKHEEQGVGPAFAQKMMRLLGSSPNH